MKILIAEDDSKKLEEIAIYCSKIGFSDAEIIRSSSVSEFWSKFDASVSICVIDLRIPCYDGGPTDQNGLSLLAVVDKKGCEQVKLLAISSYPDEFESVRHRFETRGCMIVSHSEKSVWQNALRLLRIQSKGIERMDFIIFCALQSERAPYTAMPELDGNPVCENKLTRFDITINNRRGTIIEMPRMGLVDAASTASVCIDRFSPVIVGMSGVCAGFSGRAEIGQLLISELAYEYQSGKVSLDGFVEEPYQVPVSESVRQIARELSGDGDVLRRLESGWKGQRPKIQSAPKLAAFTSGSAVVADEVYMKNLASAHRRLSGLDMEIYSIHRAAHLSKCGPDVLCAKTVVDLGSGAKNDELQPYGMYISAKFMVEAVALYFDRV